MKSNTANLIDQDIYMRKKGDLRTTYNLKAGWSGKWREEIESIMSKPISRGK